jgi:hypothetical protein
MTVIAASTIPLKWRVRLIGDAPIGYKNIEARKTGSSCAVKVEDWV